MYDPQDEAPELYEIEVQKIVTLKMKVKAYTLEDANDRAIYEAKKLEHWDYDDVDFVAVDGHRYDPKNDIDYSDYVA